MPARSATRSATRLGTDSFGFGAVSDEEAHGPLAPRPHETGFEDSLPEAVESEAEETLANEEVPEGGGYRDRTGDLRLANPSDSPTPPDADQQDRHV
jgi:hypothetical protein